MSDSTAVHDLMRAFITGALSTQAFSERYLALWCDMRDSGQNQRESGYVQRGMNIVFTAIDSLDSAVEECAKQERTQELLLAEVRAVYAVLWGD